MKKKCLSFAILFFVSSYISYINGGKKPLKHERMARQG